MRAAPGVQADGTGAAQGCERGREGLPRPRWGHRGCSPRHPALSAATVHQTTQVRPAGGLGLRPLQTQAECPSQAGRQPWLEGRLQPPRRPPTNTSVLHV